MAFNTSIIKQILRNVNIGILKICIAKLILSLQSSFTIGLWGTFLSKKIMLRS